MEIVGGWGHAAWGESEWGNRQSVVEPRFNVSSPLDGTPNVSREVWLEYEIYYYSSFPYDITSSPAVFEISEDAGATFVSAESSPYALTQRFLGGHRLWIKVVKTGLWTASTEVIIRTTLPDEFGQVITKELPVRWGQT